MATVVNTSAIHGHLDETAVPGTVHLIDIDGNLRGKHASGRNTDVILVPAPSNDPDDPLNWSPRRKLISTLALATYTLMIGIASAAIYSILTPIANDTGLTLGDLNAGTGYMFLFFGWGCLVWQPLALQYGKRPVYLFSLFATTCIMVWVPYTKTNGTWIASKILQGFFGAPIESLCEISVTDVYFSHERGTYMAVYALMLAGSNFFAPIIAGFINDGQGWHWVQYWCAIFCAIGFIICFFFMEETNYDRAPLEMKFSPAQTPGDVSPVGEKSDLEKSVDAGVTRSQTVDPMPIESYQPKTYLQKLKLLDKPRPFRVGRMMVRPLIFLTFPVIAYAGFSYGSNLVWFNVLNGTTSLILAGAPYNFSSSMVGLSYVSPLLGVLAAALYTGLFGDWAVLRIARRNKGVWESEHRLWLFCLSLIIIPSSLILWGVGAYHHIHWFGLIIAMFIIAAANTIGIQLSVSYCIDSYKDLSGDAMVTVIIIRNTMSFAIGYGITPWVDRMGLQNAFILAAFAGLAQVCTVFPMIRWGRVLRERSRERYYRYVKETTEMGLGH